MEVAQTRQDVFGGARTSLSARGGTLNLPPELTKEP
jgi:hypothetical protein